MTTQPNDPVTGTPANLPEPVPTVDPMAEPMPHVEHSYSRASFRCVRCGSTNLADGYIVDYGDKFEKIHFAPQRVALKWLNSLLAFRPWRNLATLDAVACRDCGAVLLTVQPDELRRAERVRHDPVQDEPKRDNRKR